MCRRGAGLLASDLPEGVQHVAGGAHQPVEPCHGQHVAVVEPVEQPAELRLVGLGPLATSRNTFLYPALVSWRTWRQRSGRPSIPAHTRI